MSAFLYGLMVAALVMGVGTLLRFGWDLGGWLTSSFREEIK